MEGGAGILAGADFDKQVTKLRNSLRDCEIKRLELEKKMSQYGSSNTYLCHRQYEKLQNYLREVCEKEKKARLRNRTFLQEFESIETRLRFLVSNSKISQHTKMPQVSRQAEINTSADMSRRIYHPATIFMGRQMSANSSIEHCLTQRKSPQPTKSFSISDPHSVRQAAINSNVTDSCVVPANSDTQCLNKPDKIDGETSSFQISQKMPVTSIASSEDARTHRAEIDKTQSGRKHLVESRQSAQLSSQTLKRLSPENRTGDLQNDSPGNKVEDSLMYERLVPNEERFTHASPSGSPPDACDYINNQTSDNRSACENLSAFHPVTNKEDSDVFDSSSDLTVSITESEDMCADDLLDAIDGKKDKVEPQTKNEPVEKTSESNRKLPNNKLPNSSEHNSYEDSSSISTISQNSLSSKGFIYLLECIEGMLQQIKAIPTQLYQDTGLSHRRRDYLISLCNQMKPLKTEDLEACTTLVIHQLQIDSGRSLHKEINHNRNLDQDEKRTISASLREHLLGHISFLKERGILKGGVPAGFANVLMLHDEMKSQQGNRNTAGDLSTPNSVSSTDEQSSNLLKTNQTVDERYNQMQKQKNYKIKNQDDTSLCEDDSRDGKFGEKKRVPENPTVLLQDIKDKVHTEEDNIVEFSDVSDIEIPGLTRDNANFRGISRNKQSSEGTLSSSEPSPINRKENASTVVTSLMFNKGPNNIKSKAFWGESDDSSSDIEAILRPQTNHVEGDDFDDFFD